MFWVKLISGVIGYLCIGGFIGTLVVHSEPPEDYDDWIEAFFIVGWPIMLAGLFIVYIVEKAQLLALSIIEFRKEEPDGKL